MDSYLREVGIEMETYAVNGVKKAERFTERSYESIVRCLLIQHVLRNHGLLG